MKFGRNENFIYAYSWYDGIATLSMMDSDGNYKWAYKFDSGIYQISNLIEYKEIDANTDMVIATSGKPIIYNVVITSRSPPYAL